MIAMNKKDVVGAVTLIVILIVLSVFCVFMVIADSKQEDLWHRSCDQQQGFYVQNNNGDDICYSPDGVILEVYG